MVLCSTSSLLYTLTDCASGPAQPGQNVVSFANCWPPTRICSSVATLSSPASESSQCSSPRCSFFASLWSRSVCGLQLPTRPFASMHLLLRAGTMRRTHCCTGFFKGIEITCALQFQFAAHADPCDFAKRQVIHETGGLALTTEVNGTHQSYAPWYGRGYIQLTGRDNYAAASQ